MSDDVIFSLSIYLSAWNASASRTFWEFSSWISLSSLGLSIPRGPSVGEWVCLEHSFVMVYFMFCFCSWDCIVRVYFFVFAVAVQPLFLLYPRKCKHQRVSKDPWVSSEVLRCNFCHWNIYIRSNICPHDPHLSLFMFFMLIVAVPPKQKSNVLFPRMILLLFGLLCFFDCSSRRFSLSSSVRWEVWLEYTK